MSFFKTEYIPNILFSLAIFFLLMFFLASVLAILAHFGDEQMKNYTRVPGKIIESKIEKIWKNPEMTTNTASGAQEKWLLNISFRYEVDGKEYVSNEIGRNTQMYADIRSEDPPQYMKSLVEKYLKGNDVMIWVNPQKNELAYLIKERKAHRVFYLALISGAVSLICFVLKHQI